MPRPSISPVPTTGSATRRAAAALTTGPTAVPASPGSPHGSARTRSANFAVNSSATARWKTTRSTHMQICPAFMKEPKTAASTA